MLDCRTDPTPLMILGCVKLSVLAFSRLDLFLIKTDFCTSRLKIVLS